MLPQLIETGLARPMEDISERSKFSVPADTRGGALRSCYRGCFRSLMNGPVDTDAERPAAEFFAVKK
jgi:hypothetical protein